MAKKETNSVLDELYALTDEQSKQWVDVALERMNMFMTCGDDALKDVLSWRRGAGSDARLENVTTKGCGILSRYGFIGRSTNINGKICASNGMVAAIFHGDFSNCGLGHMHNLHTYHGVGALTIDRNNDDPVRQAVSAINTGTTRAIHTLGDRFRTYVNNTLTDKTAIDQAFKLMAAVLLSGGIPIDGGLIPQSVSRNLSFSRKGLIRFSGPRRGNHTYDFGRWMMRHFPEHCMALPYFSRNPNSSSDLMEFAVSPTSIAVQDLPLEDEGRNNEIGHHWLGAITVVDL